MIITEALITKWKNGEKRKGAGVVCSVLRRSGVKEHFKFAVLRESEIDGAMKWRNHFGRDDNESLAFEFKGLDSVRDV